ncbi:type I-D CRISPR-associated protein Cas10d/Csc3 [Sphaerospermopsis sp. FACHB-1194]|uniref:type I-D CRISPR-associated protein Cas10d/Csc3 n=1 Tax=Sphaerospermopsis sp. FACHB-1194 TaxID=2692862 RepID=UPI001680737F|nr:type I-D CRISPR-associated protein Cas10d/Csc3 [Sphaerospermopsis sp. FACHB-1194]MBD2144482.1 type I-D CRISPR-associated protein Cas10d/Csc3 [Sphaerospermopsis sp. FACHB-1194]
MPTLLQALLIETLPADTDPILTLFVNTILPAMEREFALIPAMGGSEIVHYHNLVKLGDQHAQENAQRWANKPDQSLLVHVLNGLLIAWNLSLHLSPRQQLKDEEKRLLCLGIALHDYNKYVKAQGEEQAPPKAHEIEEIINLCRELGTKLNFTEFWTEWPDYLLEIAFLAQNTQFNVDSSSIISLWENEQRQFTIKDKRLTDILRHLLAFGDIAVHISDPAEIITTTKGDRLRDHLYWLNISKKLVYHRLRDCRGLITNQIHNAVVNFAHELGWEEMLCFAQGVVYLAPNDVTKPQFTDVQTAVWDNLINGNEERNQKGLAEYFQSGDVGYVRDGKGLKIAPQTSELFTPKDLICQLPEVVQVKVANTKSPATPKRLEKLDLNPTEIQFLNTGADIRADRLAEFIILAQKEFFANSSDYINWILNTLELAAEISPEATQKQSGGVNYGWYQVAAHYIAKNPTLDENQVRKYLQDLANKLANWAEENKLLAENSSPTYQAFIDYLSEYLEIFTTGDKNSDFTQELTAYTQAKITNKPLCSFSSGEALAEEQLDTVVLFKPQQYSNKNALGGGRIKRGISKIWSLEMLLRQAFLGAPAGKLEEQQPVFLYIFPAYVYSPQVAKAVRLLVKEFKRVNLWEVRKHWLDAEMQYQGLQNLPWREHDDVEEGRFAKSKNYSVTDLPFMAMTYTTTRGKTVTDAWVEPIFLALSLPLLLGVKVVATASPDPLYASDQEFLQSAVVDGAAGFWQLLNTSSNVRIQELSPALNRLLITYSLHLDNRSKKPDARWQALTGTVRDLVTDVLNIFAISDQGFRNSKKEPGNNDVKRIWNYAQIWVKGDKQMQEKLKLIERIVQEYRQFYQVNVGESSHSILLPISKALEVILTVPNHLETDDIILQGAGQLYDALERQEAFKRPLLMNKTVEYSERKNQELMAIRQFMTTCVNDLFLGLYKGDRALLQENRNRIKSGAEFAYRWLSLPSKNTEQNT